MEIRHANVAIHHIFNVEQADKSERMEEPSDDREEEMVQHGVVVVGKRVLVVAQFLGSELDLCAKGHESRKSEERGAAMALLDPPGTR